MHASASNADLQVHLCSLGHVSTMMAVLRVRGAWLWGAYTTEPRMQVRLGSGFHEPWSLLQLLSPWRRMQCCLR